VLAGTPLGKTWPNLLVGNESSDDAAVYRLNESQALVATTDFFTPIVDDPYDFGRIAATNAISDVYAMGARPILALALLSVPLAYRLAGTQARRVREHIVGQIDTAPLSAAETAFASALGRDASLTWYWRDADGDHDRTKRT